MNKVITLILILVLLAGNLVLGFKYYSVQKELGLVKQMLKTQQFNDKVLGFTTLFISKVLKAEKEVSFEDRLKLENAVRDIEDQDIFDQWQKFIQSKTEDQAQQEVKNLLEMLVKKIKY